MKSRRKNALNSDKISKFSFSINYLPITLFIDTRCQMEVDSVDKFEENLAKMGSDNSRISESDKEDDGEIINDFELTISEDKN